MIVKEINNNTYECVNGETIYAPNEKTAIKRCKENRKRTVFTLMTEIKKISYNKGDALTEDLIDDVMSIVKDMM